ncbi:MAG: Holliday junction branch migration protein RuvA [Candidatus Moranbacteria bacterium]|jgi:Holliday junction DNA helicase RuvA|nr:Holliday junction branch migration protein RuvA [Candidatus Moranbacteria bacterium]
MIAKLRGKVEYLRGNYAVIDVNGIGYKVFVTDYVFGKLASMKEVNLFIHTHIREDEMSLYGFLVLDELEMFELLISISGIGPKAAKGILSIADPRTIRTAILNNDSSILTKVSGVGKKTAERVILELKNKVVDMPDADKKEVVADGDTLEALVAMGYSISEAREALKLIPSDISDVGDRIKFALRNIGR